MFIPSQYFLNKLLAQLADHAVAGPFSGILDGVYLGLNIGTTMLRPPNTMADITEAGYTGYVRQLIVWHPPYVEGVAVATMQSAGLYFQPSDGVTPQTVTGIFLADASTAGNLLLSEPLAGGSINMFSAQNAFSVALRFQLDPADDYGGGTVIS